MKLNICNIGNKEWLDFKADISFGLFHSLKDLGHDVTISVNFFYVDRLNIVIGADFFAENEKNIQQLINSKIEYVIYEVENFDGKTINNRANFNIKNYKLLIEGSKFIITPYLANLRSYKKSFASEKIRYCRWGFHQKMIDQNIVRSDNFEFDCLYFGMLKGDRTKKIDTLKNQNNIKLKLLSRNDPLLFKSYFMSRCKWGLNLSYGSAEKFINPFRIYYMVANGMPVLADGGNDDDDYLNICKVINFSDFSKYLLKDKVITENYIEQCKSVSLTKNLKNII